MASSSATSTMAMSSAIQPSTLVSTSTASVFTEQPSSSAHTTGSMATTFSSPSQASPSITQHRLSPGPSNLPPPLSSYRLFQMPEPFSWTPTGTVAASSSVTLPGSGSTFSGQPGVVPPQQSATQLPGYNSAPSFLASIAAQLEFSTPNVTNIMTTRLNAIEDYLPWRTQFESFLVSHSLLGILDGSISTPPQVMHDFSGREVPNYEYTHWL
ncbi:unnamed protein product, partial [Cuscuta europaea]